MEFMKENLKFLNHIRQSEECLDEVCKSVCSRWRHCSGVQAINGYVDTFTCMDNYCTDLIIVRPYSDRQLKSVLLKNCMSANKQGDFPCKHIAQIERLKLKHDMIQTMREVGRKAKER
jgi:hypothetical protein